MSKGQQLSVTELKNPIVFLGLGMGSGLSPVAPGTMGTLLAVPLVWLLQQYDPVMLFLATAIVIITGPFICGYSANKFGVHDHSSIVYDEVAGYMVTMMFAPVGLFWLIAGFILFRFFDIVKPWPISWLDKHVHGGTGIMLDDIIAGIFSLICLLLIEISSIHTLI